MKRSQVYFNLHKRLFSVQQNGKVYAHADGVLMENVRFNVSKAGQRKVRETGRKNVHARVSGYEPSDTKGVTLSPELVRFCRLDIESLKAVGWHTATYNPYKNDTFVDAVTGRELHEARKVLMFTHDRANNEFLRENSRPVILYKPTLSG